MKGIILSGGSGLRLQPATKVVAKSLIPIGDRPTIYYPLSVLLLAGIKEILIISTPKDLPKFIELFGDGSNLGISISYKAQERPSGLPNAFVLGEDFIGNDSVCMVLGDNILFGHGLSEALNKGKKNIETHGCNIFGYYVNDPRKYGVIEFDKNNKVLSLEEKPENPRSNWVAIGLYMVDSRVSTFAKQLKPSNRGEIEITDLMKDYLKIDQLYVERLGRGYAWLDTGSFSSMVDAAMFVKTIEERQGLKIACIEEIVFSLGYISKEQLLEIADSMKNSEYGKYLLKISQEV